jgi:LmbE family N-acetylglucosaminyl deacetylase
VADSLPLAGRTVLGIFAHPDDESLACGGTLARLADAGARVILLCASRGEAGSISDPALVPDGDLGGVRARELRDAAAVLGVAEVIVLDHADGDLRWKDVPQLLAEIVDAIQRYQPDAVITFAEDGLYWHLDHIGVHERTYTAVRSLGAGAPALYFVTMQHGVMREVVNAAHAKGGSPPDSSFWGIAPDAFGDSAKPPTFVIDVRDWVPRKLAALRCHRTQMGPNNPMAWIDDDEARRWLGVEQFRRAALEAAGEPMLEHLAQVQHAE